MTTGGRHHDMLLVTLDTLRYDVAAELAAAGRTPNLAARAAGRRLGAAAHARRASPTPRTTRSSPASCPRRPAPGPHPRLFAARFPGSETTGDGTCVFDAPDLVTGLAAAGYHTRLRRRRRLLQPAHAAGLRAAGAVRREPLGAGARRDRPGLVRGPARPASSGRRRTRRRAAAVPVPQRLGPAPAQLVLPARRRPRTAGPATRPRWSTSTGTSAALFALPPRAAGPCFAIVCSDHGTAYGEDGYTGHRVAHEVVWTVPYAEFVLRPGRACRDELLDGSPVPGLPLRLPAQDGVPAAAARARRCATCGRDERRDALFLYLHVPFCEMRCGFCNLFTRANPPAEQVDRLPDAAGARRPTRSRDALGGRPASPRGAIGGGTPTFLDRRRAGAAVRPRRARLGADRRAVPLSVETSPATATAGPAGGARRARRAPGQHRRAELRRRRGARGRPAAAARRGRARRWPPSARPASRCSTST